MNDYINHKEYKLPNGRTVTADFNELGLATITIQAMNALFDILNSSDVVEVVRCKDCEHGQSYNMFGSRYCLKHNDVAVRDNDFCSYGEREK